MDCQFCFPLRIDLRHRDYFKSILFSLHVLCLGIVFIFGGMAIMGFGIGVCVVSLKFHFEQQKTIGTFVALDGYGLHEWRLQTEGGESSAVEMEAILFIGPLLMLRLKRYGESMFWLTKQGFQDQNSWHRLRVLRQVQ